jgi:hypothetical protein
MSPVTHLIAFGKVVLYYLFVFVFALCERKYENDINDKYHAAARPEPDEGQAKSHVEATVA